MHKPGLAKASPKRGEKSHNRDGRKTDFRSLKSQKRIRNKGLKSSMGDFDVKCDDLVEENEEGRLSESSQVIPSQYYRGSAKE